MTMLMKHKMMSSFSPAEHIGTVTVDKGNHCSNSTWNAFEFKQKLTTKK
jgi:hypothetical protein